MKIHINETKKGRIAIYCDDEFLISVSREMWYTLGRSEGEEIDEETKQELLSEINRRLCYSSAIRILTLRANSEFELRQKLSKKFDSESIDFAVEKCRELFFLNDNEFAENYANELYEKKHYGAARIRQELIKKGIGREIIDGSLSKLDGDSGEQISYLLENKYSTVDLSDKKQRDKVIAALVRRGFSLNDILKTMER